MTLEAAGDEKPSEAFMAALTTEHFSLQGARGRLTSESASRASLYLASVTGSLIALGFVAGLGFFADATVEKPSKPSTEFLGVRVKDLNVLLTAASMAAAINSILVGAGAALAATTAAGMSPGTAIGLGVVIAVVVFLVHLRIAIHLYNVGMADLPDFRSI